MSKDSDGVIDQDDLAQLQDRIAGHVFEDGAKAGIAKENSTGFVLKLVDGDERGQRELQFYKYIFAENEFSNGGQLSILKQFIPQYYGCRQYRGRTFMRIENVSQNYENIMDVKIGRITWGPWASPTKVEQERSKFKSGEELGFRILGFRTLDKDGKQQILNKEEAKSLSVGEVKERLKFFLSPDGIITDAIHRRDAIIERLLPLLHFMQKQKHFRFISSSLLVSYMTSPRENSLDEVRISMIDFAHTTTLSAEDASLDTNYISGLETFLNILSQSINV